MNKLNMVVLDSIDSKSPPKKVSSIGDEKKIARLMTNKKNYRSNTNTRYPSVDAYGATFGIGDQKTTLVKDDYEFEATAFENNIMKQKMLRKKSNGQIDDGGGGRKEGRFASRQKKGSRED